MVGYSKIITKEQFRELFPYIDISQLENYKDRKNWIYSEPPPDRIIGPSELYLELLDRLQQFWNRNKEATTRTYVDQVILDVLWGRKEIKREEKRKNKSYTTFGEVWSKTDEYGGSADYMLGYGLLDTNLPTFLIVVEVKCYQTNSLPWQLLSIMSHLQKVRKDAQKKIYDTFGILTDSEFWQFFHLDQHHKIWISKRYDFGSEMTCVWKFIDFIIDTAEKMSPTSTPFNSQADLFNTDPAYKKYIARFQRVPQAIFNVDDLCEGLNLLSTE